MTQEYKDKNSMIGKWLKYCFGLLFLDPEEVGDTFALDLLSDPDKPSDPRLTEFADYLVENYIEEDSLFPPHIWAAASNCSWRTTNNCEAFHAKFNFFLFLHTLILPCLSQICDISRQILILE